MAIKKIKNDNDFKEEIETAKVENHTSEETTVEIPADYSEPIDPSNCWDLFLFKTFFIKLSIHYSSKGNISFIALYEKAHYIWYW